MILNNLENTHINLKSVPCMFLSKDSMKRTATNFFWLLIVMVTVMSCKDKSDEPKIEKSIPKNDKYTVAAYVWPSTHHDERFGDMLWPEKTGEWEIIKKGSARFEGHYQPKMPLWGYEMDDDPKVMEKWIDAASDHGVNTFIFDWYWFDEGPFLESSLNNGFLKAKNRDKMNFFLMWANHDVKQNYWNVHKYKEIDTLLWNGAVNDKNFKIIVDRVIKNYFVQSNYYKIDDKPVFSIFSLKKMIEGLRGLELTKTALDYFREQVKMAGFPGLHVQVIQSGIPKEDSMKVIEQLGINSVTQYNWPGKKEQDYIKWGSKAIAFRNRWDGELSIPFYPNVSIGWDDTPRFPDKGEKDVIRYNKSPESFAAFLEEAKKYCDQHSEQQKLITIFSWNEWIEGGYLLPDSKYGFQYLEKVQEVMTGSYDPYQ